MPLVLIVRCPVPGVGHCVQRSEKKKVAATVEDRLNLVVEGAGKACPPPLRRDNNDRPNHEKTEGCCCRIPERED